MVCATLPLAYSKWLYVYLKINMCIIYYIMLFLSESSIVFHCDM